MRKNILKIGLCLIILFGFTACNKNNNDNSKAIEFKNEYESLNGKTNKKGKIHRTISIDKDNPYEKITPQKVVEMLNNKETFYLYVGDKLCPWCRSVIEKSIEVAKNNKINKVYDIDIWDDDGNEILRDKYEVKNNELVKTVESIYEYEILLNKFSNFLEDYIVKDDNDKEYNTNEKRIFAPNYFYIEKGEVVRMTDGMSDKQEDSRDDLTEEILKDEEKKFNEFFEVSDVCTSKESC